MGGGQPNKTMLTELFNVLVEGKAPKLTDVPPGLSPHFTPNQKFLQAAVAYTNAWKTSSSQLGQARQLAQLAFQLQRQYGHGCIPHDPSQPGSGLGPTGAIEILTSSHAQLWHAAGAALLYSALQAQDATLIPLAQQWWRAEAALNHLTAWQKSWNLGGYQVIAPGARGGADGTASPGDDSPASHNSARDLDYELLLNGQLLPPTVTSLQNQVQEQAQDEAEGKKGPGVQYFTAPLILLALNGEGKLDAVRAQGDGTPLPGPSGSGPWATGDIPTLPSILFVRRQGNQHSAWFQQLSALEPQLQAGVDANGAWYKFYDSPQPSAPPVDLKEGGQSPWPAPTTPGDSVQQYGPAAG